jgi:hypothetical protein
MATSGQQITKQPPTQPTSANANGKVKALGRDLSVGVGVWILSFFSGSIAPQVVDVSHISLPWKMVAAFSVAALAALTVHAILTKGPKKIVTLWAALSVAVTFLIGINVYHRSFDPSRNQFFLLVANGSAAQKIYMHGEPGGPAEKSLGPIHGGSPHEFECVLYLAGKGWWALLQMHQRWVPLKEFHAPAGTPKPHMPTCP